MCGVVAYIGEKSIASVLLVGLTRLEYRGYDSAGVSVLDNGELQTRKASGKIKNLEELLQRYPVKGNMGIGHTRWATHGEPSRENAHPHMDSQRHIAVAHNGIIENHYALRNELNKDGYVFHSETDTEVIPYLLEKSMKKGKSMEESVYDAMMRIEGRYAVVIIYDQDPNRIFFCAGRFPSHLRTR